MKLTAGIPIASSTWLMTPTDGDRNRMIIPHITTVEMKVGAQVTVWITFRYLLWRKEFSISARMIGIGNDTTSPYRLRINVFLMVEAKYGELKNLSK